MSDTKLKLTEKQRLWANAFLKAMGEESQIETYELDTDGMSKAPGLKGGLEKFEGVVQQQQKEEIKQVKAKISGQGEDIGRKGISLDLGYRRAVRKPTDELIKSADTLLKEGKLDTELETLRETLQERYSHYFQNIQGEEDDDKGDQREKKMQAIKNRIDAISELQQKLQKGGEEKRSLKAMLMTEGEQSNALRENPEILKGIIAKEPDVATLASMLSSENWAKAGDLVVELGGMTEDHEEYMMKLAKQLLLHRVQTEKISTIFRSSVPDILLPFEIGKQTKEGKEYLKGLMKDRDQAFGNVPPLPKPLAASKEKLSEEELNEERSKREKVEGEHIKKHWDPVLAKYVITTLNKIMDNPLPKPFLETVLAAADVARQVGHQNPSELVCTAVLLRYVNPMLTCKSLETGKVSPPLEGDQRDMATAATKGLQNIANQTVPQEIAKDWKNYPKLIDVVKRAKGLVQAWALSIWDNKRKEFGYN